MLTVTLTKSSRTAVAVLLLAMVTQIVSAAAMPCQFRLPGKAEVVVSDHADGCHEESSNSYSSDAESDTADIDSAADNPSMTTDSSHHCQQGGSCCDGACGAAMAVDAPAEARLLPVSLAVSYHSQLSGPRSTAPFRPPISG